jgi:hypothetical protein
MDEAPSLDLNVAFKFFFADPQWPAKAAVGGLLTLTIIGCPALLGWGLFIQRRAIEGEEAILPEWNNLVDYWILGLKSVVSGLVWMAPYWLTFFLLFFPAMFLPLAAQSETDWWVPIYVTSMFGVQALSFLGMLYIYLILPIYTGLLAESQSLTGSLNFGRGLRLLRANWLQFAGVALLSLAINYAASFAGLVFLCLGMFFTYPIGWAIASNLFGQSYRIAAAKLAAESG